MEDSLARKREKARERQRRRRESTRLTNEERAQINVKRREQYARRKTNESEEQANRRRRIDRESHRKRRTEESLEQRRALVREDAKVDQYIQRILSSKIVRAVEVLLADSSSKNQTNQVLKEENETNSTYSYIPSFTDLNEDLSNDTETESIKIEAHEIDYACLNGEDEEFTSSTSNPLEFQNLNVDTNDEGDAKYELDRPIKIEKHNVWIASPLQYKTGIKIEDEEVTFPKNTSPTSSTVELQNLNFIDTNYTSDVKIELDRPEKIEIVRPDYLFVSDVSATTNTSTVDNYNESNNKSVQIDIITKEEINEHHAQIKLLQMKVMKLNQQLKIKDETLKELQEKMYQCQCKAKRTDVKNTTKK